MEKGIDETWLQNGFKVDQDIIYCRYAEILLTYAEAKIELNEIDNSVLDALNEVRARAYGVDKSDKASYPAFTSNDQSTLRHQLRVDVVWKWQRNTCDIRISSVGNWPKRL